MDTQQQNSQQSGTISLLLILLIVLLFDCTSPAGSASYQENTAVEYAHSDEADTQFHSEKTEIEHLIQNMQ